MSHDAEACAQCQSNLDDSRQFSERIALYPFCSIECAIRYAREKWFAGWELCPTRLHFNQKSNPQRRCRCADQTGVAEKR